MVIYGCYENNCTILRIIITFFLNFYFILDYYENIIVKQLGRYLGTYYNIHLYKICIPTLINCMSI